MTQSKSSLASLLRELSPEEQTKILEQMRPESLAALRYAWRFWGRPEQFAPGTPDAAIGRTDWTFWLLLAGRGFGKTRAGAEFAIEKARAFPGSHGALVAPTADDARKTMLSAGMEHIEGASGILAISPPDFRPVYEPSKRILTWPNGTVATLYSAEEPNRLRGPQQGNLIAQMAVPLDLAEANPVPRLRAIAAETERRKARSRASPGLGSAKRTSSTTRRAPWAWR